MLTLPIYIPLAFMLTTVLTVVIFYKATHYSKPPMYTLIAWLGLQGAVALTGFYLDTGSFPPRFVLLILPALLGILLLFVTHRGRQFIDQLDLRTLTLLHIVRIPVELILLSLFIHKAIPELMTFEGRNFDILSGITAPIIYYFGFVKRTIGPRVIFIWNLISLGLLINIVANAVLSAPFPFQQFAFDQPNRAVLYFPFVWLPCCIVPLVLFSHLVAIRRLAAKKDD